MQTKLESWDDYVDGVIRNVAKARKAQGYDYLTADHIVEALERKPHDLRHLGPAMGRAERDGVIRGTATFWPSERASRHHAPIRQWKIL